MNKIKKCPTCKRFLKKNSVGEEDCPGCFPENFILPEDILEEEELNNEQEDIFGDNVSERY